jgi:hypothetical protein
MLWLKKGYFANDDDDDDDDAVFKIIGLVYTRTCLDNIQLTKDFLP